MIEKIIHKFAGYYKTDKYMITNGILNEAFPDFRFWAKQYRRGNYQIMNFMRSIKP